jgi:5'/3'-nucleotidase SurE
MSRNPNTVRWLLALIAVAFLPGAALATGGGSQPLRILVTNDDGFDSAGVDALRSALVAAGHDVVVVAPADQQSGKGGSINTGVFDFTPGGGTMMLMNHGNDVWSLAGSPSDCVSAALDIVMAGDPPDLIVSGLNEGQNIGRPGSNTSGTEGAALRGVFRGIPAIAGSMEILFAEAGDDFPSTVASYAPAADFIARLVARLVAVNGSDVLPARAPMLNVNFPVPYSGIQGVRVTALAEGSDLELPLFDPSQGFPAFGIPPIPSFPPCSSVDEAGEFCFATVGLGFSPTPDPVRHSDLDALREDSITITPMDADMTSGPAVRLWVGWSLIGLQP